MFELFLKRPRIAALWTGIMVILLGIMIMGFGCGKEKTIIRYRVRPLPVSLISPAPDTFVTINNPVFYWHKSGDAVNYQLQLAPTSDFVTKTIDTQTADTSHTAVNPIANSTYFWRARGQNIDGEWGDWSDAEIRPFIKSDYVNYFELISQIETMGTPQDAYRRNDSLYVADGQADLTIFDISDPFNPSILRNIDPNDDDFAKGVFVAPDFFTPDSFPYAYVADMDGKIQAMNVRDTTFLLNQSFGTDQNLEDVTGLVKPDTDGVDHLWILAVSSGFNRRKLSFYKVLFTPYPDPYSYFYQIDMPADANGLCVDTNYVYVACGTSGLRIASIEDIYNPAVIGSLGLSGSCLSIDVKGNYAYIAADRAGVFVVDVTDRRNPILACQVNTAGRAKDIQVVGDYVFVADADKGLKVIDASVPDSSHVVGAYATPYAYGLYAATDYIYLCDRDLGLMVFENRISK